MTNGITLLNGIQSLQEFYSYQRAELITYLSRDNEPDWRRKEWFKQLNNINLLTIEDINREQAQND